MTESSQQSEWKNSSFLCYFLTWKPQPCQFNWLNFYQLLDTWGSQVALMVKNLTANIGDIRNTSQIPGSGRSPGEGHSNPLQYSCLESPLDRGAWRATVHRLSQSWARLKWLIMHVHRHIFLIPKYMADLCRQIDSYHLLLKALNPGYFKMLHLFSKGALRISS